MRVGEVAVVRLVEVPGCFGDFFESAVCDTATCVFLILWQVDGWFSCFCQVFYCFGEGEAVGVHDEAEHVTFFAAPEAVIPPCRWCDVAGWCFFGVERAERFVADACFLYGRVRFGFKQVEDVVCFSYFLDEFGAVPHGVPFMWAGGGGAPSIF